MIVRGRVTRRVADICGRRLCCSSQIGYVTTLSDPEGRPTIRDLVRVPGRRLFPVGRLDYNTEGLLLLTDDGPLSRDLMHPGRGVPKTYSAKVKGTPDEAALARLRRGVPIDRRRSQPAQVKIVRRGNNAWLEVTVKEGRKHQVRRMLAAVGHTVMKLKRIRFGGLDLSDLPSGRHRPLSSAEIERLRRWSEASPEGPPRRRRIS